MCTYKQKLHLLNTFLTAKDGEGTSVVHWELVTIAWQPLSGLCQATVHSTCLVEQTGTASLCVFCSKHANLMINTTRCLLRHKSPQEGLEATGKEQSSVLPATYAEVYLRRTLNSYLVSVVKQHIQAVIIKSTCTQVTLGVNCEQITRGCHWWPLLLAFVITCNTQAYLLMSRKVFGPHGRWETVGTVVCQGLTNPGSKLGLSYIFLLNISVYIPLLAPVAWLPLSCANNINIDQLFLRHEN